jgi:hypothetical protein
MRRVRNFDLVFRARRLGAAMRGRFILEETVWPISATSNPSFLHSEITSFCVVAWCTSNSVLNGKNVNRLHRNDSTSSFAVEGRAMAYASKGCSKGHAQSTIA